MRLTLACWALLLAPLAAAVWAEDAPAPAPTLAELPPMRIMPLTAPVVLEGDLAEWNREGKLGPATFDPDFVEEYSATCYAMYDAEYLYLAAVIVEPHPPYNTFPAKGVGAYNGDDLIIRMSSNPARVWPLEGSRESLKEDPELFTADFWWNHLRARAYWDGYHGMGGPLIPEEQWGGTQMGVKVAADQKGYTAEVKVPWKTINPSFHPKPGDRIGFTWEISLANAYPADPTRIFQIFLNGGGTWAFTNAGMWGQAVFVAPPPPPETPAMP